MTDVNIDVTMPIIIVTAKPFTGPEPKKNSTNAAMNVVTFASTIVEYALVEAGADARLRRVAVA